MIATDGAAQAIELADSLSRRGLMTEALGELDRAVKRAGREPRLLAYRSELRFQTRAYLAALRDIGRAIKLSPRDPSLYRQRSELLAQVNRGPEARRDLDRAVALDPSDEGLRLARLRLLIQGGEDRRARREIAVLAARGSLEALACRAYMSLRAGDCAAAVVDYSRVAAAAPPGDSLGLRARFYRLVARARRAASGRERGPRLYLCGLGLFPPYTPSLQVLTALARCEALVNNVSGGETRELLAALGGKVTPATYDNQGDEKLWTARILGELRRGRSVAFVTRGHPLVFGGLGAMLLAEARAAAIPCETLASLSSIDALLASMSRLFGLDVDGVQAREDREIARRPRFDLARPQLVFFYGALSGGAVPRFASVLRRAYPKDHPCWMFGPKYDTSPAVFPLSELPRRFSEIHPSLILYVPALR